MGIDSRILSPACCICTLDAQLSALHSADCPVAAPGGAHGAHQDLALIFSLIPRPLGKTVWVGGARFSLSCPPLPHLPLSVFWKFPPSLVHCPCIPPHVFYLKNSS